MESFEPYIVSQAPPTIMYIQNFINKEDEERILQKVNTAPIPKWVQLSNRRLQNWGGNPFPKGMISETIPQWLQFYIDKVNSLGIFSDPNIKANHVLVNEYLPGQGIMPHEDGPIFYPTIITINCGSHTVLKFQKKKNQNEEVGNDNETEKPFSVFLEPRSLIVLKDNLYHDYLHSIEEIKSDEIDESIVNLKQASISPGVIIQRRTRISLTIRNVLKTSKFKLKFFK